MSLPTWGLLELPQPILPQTSTVWRGRDTEAGGVGENTSKHTVSQAGFCPEWIEKPLTIPGNQEEVTN